MVTTRLQAQNCPQQSSKTSIKQICWPRRGMKNRSSKKNKQQKDEICVQVDKSKKCGSSSGTLTFMCADCRKANEVFKYLQDSVSDPFDVNMDAVMAAYGIIQEWKQTTMDRLD
ncbi:uncharacterized protein LOC119683108 [Teleopsis dalmanni]|uniref:uncharacterized protein LOC119683089 n=1 Tax=Teleopsis dalmanni TaxID=139649 RepID=UPI0018CE3938|nr:uncharacterized protein LOC119683089 [Teleopsis dalmanni]XP_037952629.1 uncharacterized protein LOC119683095 [Teleopsis dalmanni]XP_037952644.1 uncharacterized protein LOC119683108 [Teleopsis dalmanni]